MHIAYLISRIFNRHIHSSRSYFVYVYIFALRLLCLWKKTFPLIYGTQHNKNRYTHTNIGWKWNNNNILSLSLLLHFLISFRTWFQFWEPNQTILTQMVAYRLSTSNEICFKYIGINNNMCMCSVSKMENTQILLDHNVYGHVHRTKKG